VMPELKVSEMRTMTKQELDDELASLRAELIAERAKRSAGGAPENPGRVKSIKRTIARILTVKRERGIP